MTETELIAVAEIRAGLEKGMFLVLSPSMHALGMQKLAEAGIPEEILKKGILCSQKLEFTNDYKSKKPKDRQRRGSGKD